MCTGIECFLKDYLTYAEEFTALVTAIPVIFEGGQGLDDTEEQPAPAPIQSKNAKSLFQQILGKGVDALKLIKECKRLKDTLADMVRRDLSPLVKSVYKGKEPAAMTALQETLAKTDIRSPGVGEALLEGVQISLR